MGRGKRKQQAGNAQTSKGSKPKPSFSDFLSKNTPKVMENVQRILQDQQVPQQELAETESWLDWGINLAKEWGPLILELAPELLALL